MKLYCKKPFHQFKVGDELPETDYRTAMTLVQTGKATGVKPRKKKTDAKDTGKDKDGGGSTDTGAGESVAKSG